MENPLRSLLFVPADRADRIEKAQRSDADCLILDLEDGVPKSQKAVARQNVRRTLEAARPQLSAILVRINSSSPERSDDIEAAVHPAGLGIILPKCNEAKEVIEVTRELEHVERVNSFPKHHAKLFLLIESARGFLELQALAAASDRVTALVFGAEDWCLDMGIVRTKSGREIEIARWNISLCAHAYGLLAIDTVFADFHDTEGLLRDSEAAKRIGFSGKLAIHPRQLASIHSVFTPSDFEIAEAETIVAAFEKAEAEGRAVIAVNGSMVDKPVAERARKLLLRAKKAGGSTL